MLLPTCYNTRQIRVSKNNTKKTYMDRRTDGTRMTTCSTTKSLQTGSGGHYQSDISPRPQTHPVVGSDKQQQDAVRLYTDIRRGRPGSLGHVFCSVNGCKGETEFGGGRGERYACKGRTQWWCRENKREKKRTDKCGRRLKWRRTLIFTC